ncbi:COP9 signalosome complex subunit 1 [Diplogelasinospora grovesii]|uniref:COP9 signalosome complex subunit 1 n=1 Tax=Diplogelasinospora grovesii TaxID=303347 RepID=A0AAN6NC15_9PEZI|nr:COP9 signalosome complex subunit 1 [Diplogelasinospora grovesii]
MVDSVLTFFTAMENQGASIVKDTPHFDLETYISNYRGRTRFDRLSLIGRSCVPLCVDALKAAVAEAKRNRDTQRYREAVECLRMAAPSDPESNVDHDWIIKTEQANVAETNRLISELKGYKNNMIKESIRMGNEDLGKHFESTGDLNGAAETYAKMRADVSTPKQLVDVGKHLVRVAMQRREWGMVLANLSKMGGHQLSAEDEQALQPYLKIIQGIAFLGQERYSEAALSFLAADPTPPASGYHDIVSQNDVAIFGALLAMATMDRRELQARVLENKSFRTFLELESHLRRAIAGFITGRYSATIKILETYRPDYMLDVYLQKHVPRLYEEIRSKCIVQYLIPFSAVKLATMEREFMYRADEQTMEEELVNMVKNGTVEARIDTIDKLVITPTQDDRARMQMEALEAAQDYERQAVERLRRMGLAAADLELKNPRKSTGKAVDSGRGLGGLASDNVTFPEESPFV